MIIKSGEFITSVASVNNLIIDDKNQIAFVGRSNVGKSTLINMLVNRKNLAKTSSTPGRTRLINYFLINDSFYFVDLPGYGFAKAGKSEVFSWQSLIEPYLENNVKLKCVCVLVDIRHTPTDSDKVMINYLSFHKIPFLIVATKADKLVKTKLKPAITIIANELKVGTGNIIAVSSEKRTGKEQLLNAMEILLNV